MIVVPWLVVSRPDEDQSQQPRWRLERGRSRVSPNLRRDREGGSASGRTGEAASQASRFGVNLAEKLHGIGS